MITRQQRAGAALIEVLVAIAVFTTAAVGWMVLVRQIEASVLAFSSHENLMREADSALAFAISAPGDSLAAYASGRRFGRVVVQSRQLREGLLRLEVQRTDGSPLLSTIVLVEGDGE